jgi:radical SAM protein with 4Fe4S-binding SPASM domain
MEGATGFSRPYVISWNLTYRCNLACEHCYLDAGGKPMLAEEDAFADRRELSTEQCRDVIDKIAGFAPESVTILTGGEPLLRRDILEIVRYASERELWVVIGTNGIRVTEPLIERLKQDGVRGMALSLDALDADRHDRFRNVRGAWENTVQGATRLHQAGLPFIIQTTVGAHNAEELEAIADFAHEKLGAKVWNLYFLVQSGRGKFVTDIDAAGYTKVLSELSRIQEKYRDRMVCNAKCAPHYVRRQFADNPDNPFARTYDGGAGGCPAGTHYMGIRPNGDVTPCPYLPEFGGNLKDQSLAAIWNDSEVFTEIRRRDSLEGRCGACELAAHCGGCRARAHATSGSVLAEDPLCDHEPGTFAEALEQLKNPDDAERVLDSFEATRRTLATESSPRFGVETEATIVWEDDARERMKRIPVFVRGMVVQRVEKWCREEGKRSVTLADLETLRAKMPTPKIFGR